MAIQEPIVWVGQDVGGPPRGPIVIQAARSKLQHPTQMAPPKPLAGIVGVIVLIAVRMVMAMNGDPDRRPGLSREGGASHHQILQPDRSYEATMSEQAMIPKRDAHRRDRVKQETHQQTRPGKREGREERPQMHRYQHEDGSIVPGVGRQLYIIERFQSMANYGGCAR